MHILKEEDTELKDTITMTMKRIESHMSDNKPRQIARNVASQRQHSVQPVLDTIGRERNQTLPRGNRLSDSLSWDQHVSKILIPALQNCLQSLKIINRYLNNKFKAIYTVMIIRSKLMFRREMWGGSSKTVIIKAEPPRSGKLSGSPKGIPVQIGQTVPDVAQLDVNRAGGNPGYPCTNVQDTKPGTARRNGLDDENQCQRTQNGATQKY